MQRDVTLAGHATNARPGSVDPTPFLSGAQVQRVPSNSARLHTSAASVVVMMEAEEIDLKLEQR